MKIKRENVNLKENIIYPDFKKNIEILNSLMHQKQYKSRSKYEKDHTRLSIKLFKKMLQEDNIANEQKEEYERTVRLLSF